MINFLSAFTAEFTADCKPLSVLKTVRKPSLASVGEVTEVLPAVQHGRAPICAAQATARHYRQEVYHTATVRISASVKWNTISNVLPACMPWSPPVPMCSRCSMFARASLLLLQLFLALLCPIGYLHHHNYPVSFRKLLPYIETCKGPGDGSHRGRLLL